MGETSKYTEHPTFETVWALLQESLQESKKEDERRKEEYERRREEYERRREEYERRKEEDERRREKADREMEKLEQTVRETSRIVGKLGNRFGEMVEHMVMPALVKKFRELGFVFTKAYPEAEYKDVANNIITEVDITLENGDKVMIVEVKSKPNTKDVKEHIKRMEIVRNRARLRNDSRIFLGAIAGMVMDKSIKTFILKSGFYLIEPSGEEFFITVPEGEYSPREW